MTSHNRTWVNEHLRAHVTRVGFDLSLGRTHVEALVWLNEVLPGNAPRFPSPSHLVSGIQGCERRGLVLHHYRPKVDRYGAPVDTPLRRHYTITKAGKLVVGLLREAGIYDEQRDALFGHLRLIEGGAA